MDGILMNGWTWIILASFVAIVELVLPGYMFISIGAALAATGLLMLVGMMPFSFAGALFFCAVLSAAVWAIIIGIAPTRRGSVQVWTTDIND